ncbi:MAG: PilW family protein [Proteobacteria bacterium]|nr:PilW family protein [Pseudomonadota bacterium]MBU1710649.1 PilW family protein [Pseudomonadota bacterium]
MKLHRRIVEADNGFSLVELMVAMFLTFIATAGIYKSYISFTVTTETQEQRVEMQQDLRIALNAMAKEIRKAGYDPTDNADSAIETADLGVIEFTMDLNEDEDNTDNDVDLNDNAILDGNEMYADERVRYFLSGSDLMRQDVNAGTNQIVISNVSALQFRYFVEDGVTPADTATAEDREEIRVVQIALVVETTKNDFSYTDLTTYIDPLGNIVLAAQNDNKQRKMIVKRVSCRNMGLD